MFEMKEISFLHLTGRTMTYPHLLIYLFLGILLWIIIIGGIKRIASVASKIIPIMGLIYFIHFSLMK